MTPHGLERNRRRRTQGDTEGPKGTFLHAIESLVIIICQGQRFAAGSLVSWSEEEHAQDTIFKLSLEPADRKLLVDERVVYHDLVRIGDGSGY